MLTSTRYQISYPDPARTDTADVPRDIGAVVVAIEKSAMYGQGTLAARPVSTVGSPGIQGRFYYANDVGIMHYDFGTGWVETAGKATSYLSAYTGGATHNDFVSNPTNYVAGSRILTYSVGVEANARFYIDQDGGHHWGPGGATAVDTNLYRSAANVLETTAQLRLMRGAGAAALAVYWVITDAQPGFTIDRDGGHRWGPGGAVVTDTNLYRLAAGVVATDGGFTLAGVNKVISRSTDAGLAASVKHSSFATATVNGGAGNVQLVNFGTAYLNGLVLVRYAKTTDTADQGSALLHISIDAYQARITVINNLATSSSGVSATFVASGFGVGTNKILSASMPAGANYLFVPDVLYLQ